MDACGQILLGEENFGSSANGDRGGGVEWEARRDVQ